MTENQDRKKEQIAVQVLRIFNSTLITKWGNDYKLGQDVKYFRELSLSLENNIAKLFFFFIEKKVVSGDFWNIFSDFLSNRKQNILNNGQISS